MTPRPARTARQTLADAVPESAFTAQVLEAAARRGWRTAHFRPARTKDRKTGKETWRTAVAGDGKGFPDLVLLRGERTVIAELKAEGRHPEPDQRLWLDAWRATGAEVHVWRPSDMDAVLLVLR